MRMQTYNCYLTDPKNQVVLREEIGAGSLDEALEIGSMLFDWYKERASTELAGLEIWCGTLRLFASRPTLPDLTRLRPSAHRSVNPREPSPAQASRPNEVVSLVEPGQAEAD